MSRQHTPTRCMIKGSYLCLFQENPTTVISAVSSGCGCVYIHLPSLFVTAIQGKAWKLWKSAHRDYSSSPVFQGNEEKVRLSFLLCLERERDFTLKAVDHKGNAEITQQKKRSYEKAFEGHNQKGILARDILQTVWQKHNEEMQSSASAANKWRNVITYLKLKKKDYASLT